MDGLVGDLRHLLDCDVSHDEETRKAFSSDFGQVIHRHPRVVVHPRTSADVSRVLRYASSHGVTVSSQAARHSFGGQSLNQDGISIDMKALRTVHRLEAAEGWFQADAGTPWRVIVEAGLSQSLLPPVLTNYHEATIGGTHSAGGFGIASFRQGCQLEHCIGLEVITVSGERLWCSPEENEELFQHALGGFGQFGIITQVRHRLRRVRPNVRRYRLIYAELEVMLEDCRRLMAEGRADYMAPTINLCRTRGRHGAEGVEWGFTLEVLREFSELDKLDDSSVLGGLKFVRRLHPEDMPVARFAKWLNSAQPRSFTNVLHPSLDFILPWSAASEFTSTILSGLPLPISPPYRLMTTLSVIPLAREKLTKPMLRVPEEKFLLGFSIHPYVPVEESAHILPRLRMANDLAYDMGGTRYLVGWLPFEAHHWKRQFDTYWPKVLDMKARYDPLRLLNPGFCSLLSRPTEADSQPGTAVSG